MSGGVGSKFWPISRANRPKQFLDFFGTGQSMLQITYNRFRTIIPAENIFIITNESYYELTKEQLPEINDKQILLEPQRRNTAPCIAWGAYHIRAINPNANIVVTPSDHLILNESEFTATITKAMSFSEDQDVLITLGIRPTHPEIGFGYIQKGNEQQGEFCQVKTFTEKPNIELARIFIESGEFLWNSGIFIWKAATIIEAIQKYQPEISGRFESGIELFNTPAEKGFIDTFFPTCPNISIDFGVMEKASNVFTYEASFGWSDLGTWGSLYEHSEKDNNGNVNLRSETIAYESANNLISVASDRLVVIQGLNDYIVAEDNNVLMICERSEEERIRKFASDAKLKFGDQFI